MQYIPVLTIAGSDSVGGAGIQADIKTISALGCYAASAITAVTVQNTTGVKAVHAVPADIVEGQIRAVMDDIHPVAVKIGMVNDIATINAIANALSDYIDENSPKLAGHKDWKLNIVVVDPVMVSTSGSPLMRPDALAIFRQRLMPLATLLTPNMPEAEMLSGISLSGEGKELRASLDKAGKMIAQEASAAVLIKGGHITEGKQKNDYLYGKDGELINTFSAKAVATKNTHGTGCSLSSAIASLMARGMSLTTAVTNAKEWITEAIKAGADVEIGEGNGPINHFYEPHTMIKIAKVCQYSNT